jgi:hypothetical protein
MGRGGRFLFGPGFKEISLIFFHSTRKVPITGICQIETKRSAIWAGYTSGFDHKTTCEILVVKGFDAPVPPDEKTFFSPFSTIPVRAEIEKGQKDKKIIRV